MRMYFAGPLFNEAERTFNLQLSSKLEAMGFSVFLPQRDGIEILKAPYNTMPTEDKHQAIFEIDRDELLEADILLVILDGRVPDEGACVELGIAYGQKYLLQHRKMLIGLHTDMRAAFPDAPLNAMVACALDVIVHNVSDLLDVLEEHRYDD
jgi:nucleoside 2-deoxyribosyltransferase